jgi:hypothetical protein
VNHTYARSGNKRVQPRQLRIHFCSFLAYQKAKALMYTVKGLSENLHVPAQKNPKLKKAWNLALSSYRHWVLCMPFSIADNPKLCVKNCAPNFICNTFTINIDGIIYFFGVPVEQIRRLIFVSHAFSNKGREKWTNAILNTQVHLKDPLCRIECSRSTFYIIR